MGIAFICAHPWPRNNAKKAGSTPVHLHESIRAAMALGVTQDEIAQVLKGSGVSDRDVSALIAGETPQWQPSKQFMKRAMKRAISTAPDEVHQHELLDEFVRRREVLRDAIGR